MPRSVGESGGPTPVWPERWRGAAACFILAAITLAVFWPATGFDFINLDDAAYFYTNPHILSGLKWENVRWAFHTGYLGNWHPVTWLSFMLDVTLFGPGPHGPHLANVLLHTLNSVLVFLLLRRMTGALWRSALVAGLFALHPLRVESVAWVTERKDVLSGLLFLLTLCAYVRYVELAKARRPAREGHRGSRIQGSRLKVKGSRFSLPPYSIFYLLSLFLFALGLMSKPMLVTLPFVLLLLDYWPLQRLQLSARNSQLSTLYRLAAEKLPFLLLSCLFCIVTFSAQSRAGAVMTWVDFPLAARIQNALVSYARYLGKTFWPVDLAVGYPRPDWWPWTAVAAAAALSVGLGLGALWFGRRRPYLATGWFWWFGMLLPVIGLAQAGGQAMADRFTYLPAAGLFVGLVWGAEELARSGRLPRWVGVVGAGAVVAGCCLQTMVQLHYWRNSETLFRHAIACTSGNYLAHNCLGVALAAQRKLPEAIQHYQLALQSAPGYASAHLSLADTLAAQGKWAESTQHYEQALQSRPYLADAHLNLANVLRFQGKWDEVIRHCELALQANPDVPEAHNDLGVALAQKGQLAEAIAQYQRALHLRPDYAQAHYNLARALVHQQQWAEAMAHYEQALAIQPGALPAMNNLAWLLATCPQATLRNGPKALALARELDRLSGGRDGDNLDVLAAACAEAGEYPQAVEAAGRALALAATQTNLNVEEIRARLELYRNRSAFHEPSPNQ